MTTSGRPPELSLRISITDRCQLRCLYCRPDGGASVPRPERALSFEEILRFVHGLRSDFEVQKVHVTGGEPLIRHGVASLVRMLAREGIPDLALTTNGQRLAQMAEELKGAGLRRVNVSLDTLRPDRFKALTRGGELSRTLNGIEAALRAGLTPAKINTVVMRSYNDDELADLVRFALNRGCQVRFLELMPIGCARAEFHRRFVSSFEVRARLAESFDLRPLPYEVGQTSRSFMASDSCDRRGLVGFISPCTQSFCFGCTRIRLTCTGRLVGCLAQGTGRSLGPLLRSDSPQAVRIVNRIVMEALEGKAQRSGFENAIPMAHVGG